MSDIKLKHFKQLWVRGSPECLHLKFKCYPSFSLYRKTSPKHSLLLWKGELISNMVMNALRGSHFHLVRMAGMRISNEPNKCGQLCNGLQLNGEKNPCFSMAFYFSFFCLFLKHLTTHYTGCPSVEFICGTTQAIQLVQSPTPKFFFLNNYKHTNTTHSFKAL